MSAAQLKPHRFTSFSDLPVEVQLEISQHLDLTSLKSFRQVERGCIAATSKHLFKEIKLWPLIWSWTRLEAMSQSPFVHDYVDTLRLHTIVLNTSYLESKSGREDFIRMMQRIHRQNTPACHDSSVSTDPLSDQEANTLFAKYRLYVGAQRLFEKLDVTAIRRVICGFSNLKAIVCDERRYNIFDSNIDFLPGPSLARSVDLTTRADLTTTPVLDPFYCACMSSRLHHLILEPVLWRHLPVSDEEDIPSSEQQAEPRTYDDHRTLVLSLDNKGYLTSSRMQDTYLARLTNYISRYTNLGMLTLSFGATHFLYNYAEILLKISAALTRLHLPQLWYLALANVFTTEKSMTKLLQNHSKSLRFLQLSSIGVGLPRNARERESVLSLFWKIRQVTFLEKVKLKGLFTNMVDEAWEATEGKQLGCRTQLEDFMSHKIDWPVGVSLEEYLLLKEERLAATKQEAKANAAETLWQDRSWAWSAYFIERCRGFILLQAEMR
ncbi:uncharacterized protein A1O9_05119 [Exophiala aquamarina CBS 119918]|uniref:F-box domain-containing protein n=1 Tax=Exophiala aquamarina CBS 119918 TaxID=1182545 RepID=A0A072PJM4_9EURO|nr:uncharacterized protein A1O9_05119 [Exophiala aquamarina CBS 119918]KEF60269.1 hypothetical protein A1O9_05119 [Exophiala aquamarina CBS 119918]